MLALITQRLLKPASKLATARALDPETSHSSLGQQLEIGTGKESDLYASLDWLLEQQPRLEAALAKRHLSQGALVLYDLTSTYFEGRKARTGRRNWNRWPAQDPTRVSARQAQELAPRATVSTSAVRN